MDPDFRLVPKSRRIVVVPRTGKGAILPPRASLAESWKFSLLDNWQGGGWQPVSLWTRLARVIKSMLCGRIERV